MISPHWGHPEAPGDEPIPAEPGHELHVQMGSPCLSAHLLLPQSEPTAVAQSTWQPAHDRHRDEPKGRPGKKETLAFDCEEKPPTMASQARRPWLRGCLTLKAILLSGRSQVRSCRSGAYRVARSRSSAPEVAGPRCKQSVPRYAARGCLLRRLLRGVWERCYRWSLTTGGRADARAIVSEKRLDKRRTSPKVGCKARPIPAGASPLQT